MSLTGMVAKKPQIQIMGMFGSFTVASGSAQKVTVRYFNTVASGQDTPAAGNSLALLRELKPMRERVRVSDLRDLGSLLQRELDDHRVAHELVPYLKGESSPVGFFPGILVALVPRGFLKSETTSQYPEPSEPADDQDMVLTKYGNHWSGRRFKINGQTVSLGSLEIDPETTDLIVLDGQHRANAFRFTTKTFGAVQDGNSIYGAFYEGVKAPETFESELPVTVVWFESDESIDPKLISRKLFVDVNMNAKPVSESRKILLDDRDRAAIVTGSLYRLLAANAFDASPFSLLHTGFDCEEKQAHALTLILPSIVHFAVSFAAFGRDEADGLSFSPERLKKQSNFARLRRISPDVEEADFRDAEDGDRLAFERVTACLDEKVASKLLAIIEQHPLTIKHVEAAIELDAWIPNQPSTPLQEAWDKVFCGGEGLYGGFIRAEQGVRVGNYQKAIHEIDRKFVELRAGKFSGYSAEQLSRAYETFASKAGIAGLLMAAHSYCKKQPDGWEAYGDFIAAVQKLSAEQWVSLLVDYKPVIIPELKPLLWPGNRNIILRALQGVEPELNFFSSSSAADPNPDVIFLQRKVHQTVDGYYNSLSLEDRLKKPSEDQIQGWGEDAVSHLNAILERAGLDPINSNEALLTVASSAAVSRVDLRFPDQGQDGPEDHNDDDLELEPDPE